MLLVVTAAFVYTHTQHMLKAVHYIFSSVLKVYVIWNINIQNQGQLHSVQVQQLLLISPNSLICLC